MDEIITISYGSSQLTDCCQCTNAIKNEMLNISTGFVRIGYLLRKAADTGLIIAGGYKNLEEYAMAEFNMDKSAVSRFIHINEKYSEGGYSDHMRNRYQGYSYSSLSEMLTLPDELAAEITPEHTREQIRDIKKEIKEEQEITGIEAAMEIPEERPNILDNTLKIFLYSWLHDHPEEYVAMHKAVTVCEKDEALKKMCSILAPSGVNTIFTRIPAVGKLMLTITGYDKLISIINVRNAMEGPESYRWDEVVEYMLIAHNECISPEENWEMIYAEDFPGKNETVKMPENPHNNPCGEAVEKEKKEPANGVNTSPKNDDDKKTVVDEEKTLQKNAVEHGKPTYDETDCEKSDEKTQNTENLPQKQIKLRLELPEDMKTAADHISYLCQYLREQRWRQALFEVRDLNDEIIKLRDKAKVIDIPGQMSLEDNEEDSDETETTHEE